MAEKYYEGMFLLDSGQYANNPQKAEEEVLQILEKAGAKVVAHRPWQESKLAYPIEGHTKGLYYLTFFSMENNGVPQIDRACKLSGLVLRHLVLRHPKVLFDAMVQALTNPQMQQEELPEEEFEEGVEGADFSDMQEDLTSEEAVETDEVEGEVE